ncbi:MAG: M18 family aminopeptidase, partial [Bacilli bacterium]|nr:M18 family aminopeptidase [Bacilli bacterium]
EWTLSPEGKYYVKRNDSSLIAFKLPKHCDEATFLICAAHTDSPTFKIKPEPLIIKDGLTLLDIEPYGGAIYAPWLDRALSFAGRVVYEKDGKYLTKLVDLDEDSLVIPNVAIHMNRTINSDNSYNPAVDLRPILNQGEGLMEFDAILKSCFDIDGEILSHDLFLYNRDKARYIGLNNNLLLSSRLDDLACAYTNLFGFIESTLLDKHIAVYVAYDNEEVGSLTRQGADSNFLEDTLKKIACLLKQDYSEIVARSVLLSADNAHANHPNHPEYSDIKTNVRLNEGIVIKYNANQHYTTDALSSAIVKALCQKLSQPYQEFTNRSDLRGGSTLGNISNAHVSIVSCDIGIAQLAMHSNNELCGAEDVNRMALLLNSFYSSNLTILEDGFEL